MPRFPLFLLLLLAFAAPAQARVELALSGKEPVTITEVYLREGVSYLPAEDVLAVLGLSGQWDSVEHTFRIKSNTVSGSISPGSHYMRLGERFIPVAHPPRFIDGRLRVAEDFVARQLTILLGEPIHLRNLDPHKETAAEEESPLDRLFAFLLRKKEPSGGPVLRGIAIDPGHGGEDVGAIGPGGAKEKSITLEIARQLEKQLKMQMEIPIYLSRDRDYSLSPAQRLETAARPDTDMLIQLHAQSSFGPAPHGISLIIRQQEETTEGTLPHGEGESMRLALSLAAALRSSGLDVAGIFPARLLPLGRGDLPTVLVELGYLTNPADRALLVDRAGQERVAGALFNGLRNYIDTQKEILR